MYSSFIGFETNRLISEDFPVPLLPRNNIVKLDDDILILYKFWSFNPRIIEDNIN